MKEAFSLDQLLDDPLIRMVMSSDAVEEGDIRKLAARFAANGAGGRMARELYRPPADALASLQLAAAQIPAVFAPVACYA